MLRILVTVEEEAGKDLIRMKQVTVVLTDDVLEQIANHVASQQSVQRTAEGACGNCGNNCWKLVCETCGAE